MYFHVHLNNCNNPLPDASAGNSGMPRRSNRNNDVYKRVACSESSTGSGAVTAIDGDIADAISTVSDLPPVCEHP